MPAQRTLRLFGISEARLQQVVSQLPDFQQGGVTVGFYPNFPETHLTLTTRGRDRQTLEETLDRLTSSLAREVGDLLLGSDLVSLEALVGRYLQKEASPWRWRSLARAASSGTASPTSPAPRIISWAGW